MRNKIFCLMFSGVHLSEVACEVLYQAACNCYLNRSKEKKVYNDDVEGVVHTDFETCSMGTISGTVFVGEIQTKEGSSTVSYIVTGIDLSCDNYEWVSPKVSEWN